MSNIVCLARLTIVAVFTVKFLARDVTVWTKIALHDITDVNPYVKIT